ncbi:MAG: hypothetical protein K0Q63_531 [Paenibacillus sp.]|nr:hypothetical protein [Paenibacillus sp.]
MLPLVYYYKDMMEADFPFKLELRSKQTMNRVYHAHEHLQLCYITRGMCVHHVAGQAHTLVKGDLIAIPPFLAHRLEMLEEEELELVQIDYMPIVLGEGEDDLMLPLFPKIRISPRNQVLIEQLITNMKAEHDKREEGYRQVIKGDLLKLIVTLFRESKADAGPENNGEDARGIKDSGDSRLLLTETVRYIEDNAHLPLSLEDMARRAALSPNYFSYVFKVLKGQTFVQFVNDLRVRRAIDLLVGTDWSTTAIGFEAGFNNTSHFHRVFKKATGLTPMQYRSGQ